MTAAQLEYEHQEQRICGIDPGTCRLVDSVAANPFVEVYVEARYGALQDLWARWLLGSDVVAA